MRQFKIIAFILFFIPLFSVAQNTNGYLLNLSKITVKQGHEKQFLEGVRLYKECYLKNKGTEHWNLWHRVQGKGNVFILSSVSLKWADMDKSDPADKECHDIVSNFIMPHIESTEYNIAQNMPEFSIHFPDSTKLIWVTNFKVKKSSDFLDVVKEITSALKTVEGNSRGIWYRTEGGEPETPDYFISTPYKGFSDLDKDEDSIWKIYEKVNGKKATDLLKAKATSSIDKIWSYLYILEKDLSN